MAPVATGIIGSGKIPDGAKLDALSDAVDEVNIYLGKHPEVPLPREDKLSGGAVVADGEKKEDDNETWRTKESDFGTTKDKTGFRDFVGAAESVKALYQEQHAKQTVEYNIAARKTFLGKCHARMTVWQAIEKLSTLIDQADPDTSLSQIQHLLQTAEAMRRDGKPDWMQLTGLIHDLGKLLIFFGADGQWDVVGDTFIVGCKFTDDIIYPEMFDKNPDKHDPRYNTECGMYALGCGLDNVMFSWGHDGEFMAPIRLALSFIFFLISFPCLARAEFLYWRMKAQSRIPQAGLDMIRLHSCYPLHREGAYRQFFAPGDDEKIKNVLAFNVYDLYSKNESPADPVALRPYYEALIDKYIIGGRDALLEW